MIDTGIVVFEGEFLAAPVSVVHGPPMLRGLGPNTDLTAYCAYFAAP